MLHACCMYVTCSHASLILHAFYMLPCLTHATCILHATMPHACYMQSGTYGNPLSHVMDTKHELTSFYFTNTGLAVKSINRVKLTPPCVDKNGHVSLGHMHFWLRTLWATCTFGHVHLWSRALLATCTFGHVHLWSRALLATCTFGSRAN